MNTIAVVKNNVKKIGKYKQRKTIQDGKLACMRVCLSMNLQMYSSVAIKLLWCVKHLHFGLL